MGIIEISGKYSKSASSEPLASDLEIRYVALPSGAVPSLFKPRSEGPKWPYARGSWV